MSEVNTNDLAAQLGQLTIPQIVALTKQLEAAWGVSATPQVSNQAPQPSNESKVEQTEFDVVLASYPVDKKMGLIKLVRDVCSLGLLEAKTLVESVPKTLKEGVSKEDAEALKAKLTEAGGVVEVK